jgi:pyruvate/2-oxoacid:ferredoxin oxidoreductase alpha subunit
MHESLYAAVGKRLTYVLNVACRSLTKQALNIYAGHDDYHAIDDTGCFQLFAADVQQVADLNLVAHRIAELSLNPGVCAQDGFLTSHALASYRRPEPELVREYLGDPADLIETPTPAQRSVFGDTRRRIPELYDFDYPSSIGVVQNSESYAQGVAAQRPFYFDHIPELADRAFDEYAELTGRRYARAMGYRLDDADYVFVGQGSVVRDAEAVALWLREQRRIRVGVLNLAMFRPFPADLVAELLAGKKGVVVLERTDQPRRTAAPGRPAVTAGADCAGGSRPTTGRCRTRNCPRWARNSFPTCTPPATAWAGATCSRLTWWPRSRTCSKTARGAGSSTSASSSSTRTRRCPRCRSARRACWPTTRSCGNWPCRRRGAWRSSRPTP